MTHQQTISWIFLAIAVASSMEPAKVSSISLMADGINHAVPTQKELQMSITWLIKKELIVKQGKHYQLTEKGKLEYETFLQNSDTLREIWKALENRFNDLDNE